MAFNLGLVMRSLLGAGTPRGLAGLRAELWRLRVALERLGHRLGGQVAVAVIGCRRISAAGLTVTRQGGMATYSTGC